MSVQLLTVREVAERLQMGKSKIFEFIATGELESLKLDRSRRVSEEQLADFVARRTAATQADACPAPGPAWQS